MRTLLPASLLATLGWLGSGTVVYAQEAPPVAAAPVAAAFDEAGGDVQGQQVDAAVIQAAMQDPQHMLLRSYVRVNAALARRCGPLTDAEEASLAELNDVWIHQRMQAAIDSPIKNAAAGIARFLQGRAARVNNLVEQNQQIIERVKHAADKHIDAALTEEHRAVFHDERAQRDKYRYDSLARVLVAALDSRVFLSAEQRQQLEHDVAKWIKKDLYWQFYFQNQNFVPGIPQSILTQVLNKEQLASLKGAQSWLYELAQIEVQLLQEAPILIER